MSSTPPATPELNPALGPITPAEVAPVETAPSATIAQGPTLVRVVGFIGLFLAVLGLVVIVMVLAVIWYIILLRSPNVGFTF